MFEKRYLNEMVWVKYVSHLKNILSDNSYIDMKHISYQQLPKILAMIFFSLITMGWLYEFLEQYLNYFCIATI